jgi:hypothetical protein
MIYCSEQDVYSYGLPRGSVANPARLISAIDIATDTFTLTDHGFTELDRISLRADAGGERPLPVASGVQYFVVPVDDHHFQISTTQAGAPINLTEDGRRVLVVGKLPILSACEWASRIIDDSLPAHLVPLEDPIPDIVRMTAAELTAGKLGYFSGSSNNSLGELVDAAQKRLARWGRGVPLRGANVPPRANLALRSTTRCASDARGWRRWGGIS